MINFILAAAALSRLGAAHPPERATKSTNDPGNVGVIPAPDALASALPGIVRRAAVRVEVCPPDPRLSEPHQTIALAYDRAPTHALTIGVHRLSPATGAHKNPSTTRKP